MKNLQNVATRTRFAVKKFFTRPALAAVATLGGASSAMASEGGSQASAAFAELASQAEQMAGEAWPVVVGIVGSLLAIGLFKKFANKAA